VFPESPGQRAVSSRHNLPTPLTPLVGRQHVVEEICVLLRRPEVRLLTLSGTGGVGKTRVGLQVGSDLVDTFADGVYFIPLASLGDPDLVLPTLTQTLRLPEATGNSVLEHLKDSLREKHLLLLLDNFEHVAVAAPLLVELLQACPGLKALVTSRSLLRVRGEYEMRIAPLDLPDLEQHADIEALAHNPAVTLFTQRAQALRPDFALTQSNARTVAEICQRLDGLPLAIELAAACMKLLSSQQLLNRLNHRLAALASGAQDLPARQQTLRNTLQWSYDLLLPGEQRLFRLLSTFVGGCSLEAIEAVCYYDRRHEQVSLLDEVSSLVDKSLLFPLRRENEEPRFLMLKTIHEYAQELLRESEAAQQAYRAHALYYLALAEKAEHQQLLGEQIAWLKRLEDEHNNFRAALGWLIEQREIELALRLCNTLYWFWSIRGHGREGLRWLQGALSGSEGFDLALRAKALNHAGALAYNLTEYDQTEIFCREALALLRQQGDKRGCATSLYWLGQLACWVRYSYGEARAMGEEALSLSTELNEKSEMADDLSLLSYVALNQGDYINARLCIERSLALFREVEDTWGMAYALRYLAEIVLQLGEYDTANRLVEESQTLSSQLNYVSGIAYALTTKGHIVLMRGDLEAARSLIEESLVKHREAGHRKGITYALFLLAKVALYQGSYAEAYRLYEECLTLLEKLVERDVQAGCLEGLGLVALALKRPVWAAQLWGAAAQLRESVRTPMLPLDRVDYTRAELEARQQLGEEQFVVFYAQGHTMTPMQALTSRAQIQPEPDSVSPTAASGTSSPASPAAEKLTARELEVLRLLAQGLTSAQIAEQLVIGLVTVNSHVRSIYSKLGVKSRSAATRYAIEHHLL
jgi:predicted ATPase/DNA-binding CsgD family transcriptional regulator